MKAMDFQIPLFPVLESPGFPVSLLLVVDILSEFGKILEAEEMPVEGQPTPPVTQ